MDCLLQLFKNKEYYDVELTFINIDNGASMYTLKKKGQNFPSIRLEKFHFENDMLNFHHCRILHFRPQNNVKLTFNMTPRNLRNKKGKVNFFVE